jgi:hypothetical protein
MKNTFSSSSSPRRGSVAGVVLTIIALAAVVGIAAYFVSPVFRTQVKAAARDVTTWTDADIVANPELYFTYAIEQFQQKEKELAANVLALNREREAARQKSAAHTSGETALAKVVAEARAAYNAAPADAAGAKQFPLAYGRHKFDTLAEFKAEVFEAENQRKLDAKLAEAFNSLAARLDASLAKLAEKRSQIKMTLATASANLELIKTQKAIAGVEKIGGDIKDLMVNCDLLAKETSPAKFTLKDAAAVTAATTASAANDAAFEALMRQ